MQKLDSEKFRAALEAIVVEKSKRRQPAKAPIDRPRQTGEHMPAEAFEALLDKKRHM